jgi:oligopeptide transport system substrate-binding protein
MDSMADSAFDRDLKELIRTFSRGASTRRDFLRVSTIAAGAVVTAGMLAACGGDDDDDLTETNTPATGQATQPATGQATQPASTGSPAAQQTQAAGATGDFETGVAVSLPWKTFGVSAAIDPHRSPNWGPYWYIIPFAYGGLVQFDENAIVQPDLAESWEVSNGGLTYTFKIRDDAKFASGRDVVADDFVYSWKRALDPEQGSPMLHFVEHLAGYKEFNEGTATEISGVKVIDPKTIELTLSKPYNFFLSYLGTFVWYIVDKDAVEQHGDNFAAHPSGTGPWMITKMDPQLEIVMEPNPHYYGGVNPSISRLTFKVLQGPTADNTGLNLFKSNETLFTDVPIALLDAVKQDNTLNSKLITIDPSGSIRSMAMNFDAEPFGDVRVRRAFGHAIDRETFCNVIWRGTWKPAEIYTPLVVLESDPGYNPPRDAAPKFDPDLAKELLAEAGYPNGEGLPEIKYYVSSEESSDEINRWQAFVNMLNENLGIKSIVLDTSMTQDQIDKKRTEEGGLQLEVWWWGNITETPQLMSEVFRTDSPYMKGTFNWSHDLPDSGEYTPGADAKRFDELMEQADVEQDIDKMNELYAEGEELVLKNAVYVPIANWVPHLLVQPWVKNMRIGWWNFSAPSRFEPDVVVVKH